MGSAELAYNPISIENEKPDGASAFENTGCEAQYILSGCADEAAAISTLQATAPLTLQGLDLQKLSVSPIDENSGYWRGSASYGKNRYDAGGETTIYEFDTGNEVQHINQSLETIAKYPSTTAPDFKGAIGVSSNGVAGVDVPLPGYNWKENLKTSSCDQTYRLAVADLRGKVNAATFRGFPAGEVLFMGATGSKTNTGWWSLTFNFQRLPNTTSKPFAGFTINKKGWEVAWAYYLPQDDATAKMVVQKPVAAYVEKVFESGNFSDLGI